MMDARYQRIIADAKGIGLDFRINDLNEALQVQIGGQWQDLTDTLQAIIQTDMAELGYGVRGRKKPAITQFWDAATKRGNQQRHNPIKDWFKGLENQYTPLKPEGAAFPQPYLIPKLSGYFDNPDGYFGVWLFRWMVGAIAKVFIQERSPMLVLVSDQNMGKSYFAKWLCSLGDEYFLEGPISPDSKDSRLRLTDRFIHEVGELGATTRRADAESLKEFITKKWVSDRMPYGKRPINKPAVCSFIGSVNHDGAGFLNDSTGSTRFLACEISSIDWSYTELNPNLLWAEAYWFYKNAGNAWQLTPQESAARDRINAQFEMVMGLEFVVDELLEITGDETDFMSTLELRDLLALHYRFTNETAFFRDLARVMKKAGVQGARRPFRNGAAHQRGYKGLKKRDQEGKKDAEKF